VLREHHLVGVTNEETESALLVEVPAPFTSFDASASWLDANTEHQVQVGVKTATGNLTNVETAFFTGL